MSEHKNVKNEFSNDSKTKLTNKTHHNEKFQFLQFTIKKTQSQFKKKKHKN